MSPDDNSVNIKSARRPYHHGDLRAAVIAAALRRLESATADTLSLREVARDVGVSPTAIYRHFPDKDSLLGALAIEAAERMGAQQMAAHAAAGGGMAGFRACGRAYVDFALNNQGLFRLMIACTNLGEAGGHAENSTAMRFLHESVDALIPPETPAPKRLAIALHAWALVHGMAVLMLDGQIPSSPAVIDAILDNTAIGDGRWVLGGSGS